jgi:hypothetical protein
MNVTILCVHEAYYIFEIHLLTIISFLLNCKNQRKGSNKENISV